MFTNASVPLVSGARPMLSSAWITVSVHICSALTPVRPVLLRAAAVQQLVREQRSPLVEDRLARDEHVADRVARRRRRPGGAASAGARAAAATVAAAGASGTARPGGGMTPLPRPTRARSAVPVGRPCDRRGARCRPARPSALAPAEPSVTHLSTCPPPARSHRPRCARRCRVGGAPTCCRWRRRSADSALARDLTLAAGRRRRAPRSAGRLRRHRRRALGAAADAPARPRRPRAPAGARRARAAAPAPAPVAVATAPAPAPAAAPAADPAPTRPPGARRRRRPDARRRGHRGRRSPRAADLHAARTAPATGSSPRCASRVTGARRRRRSPPAPTSSSSSRPFSSCARRRAASSSLARGIVLDGFVRPHRRRGRGWSTRRSTSGRSPMPGRRQRRRQGRPRRDRPAPSSAASSAAAARRARVIGAAAGAAGAAVSARSAWIEERLPKGSVVRCD